MESKSIIEEESVDSNSDNSDPKRELKLKIKKRKYFERYKFYYDKDESIYKSWKELKERKNSNTIEKSHNWNLEEINILRRLDPNISSSILKSVYSIGSDKISFIKNPNKEIKDKKILGKQKVFNDFVSSQNERSI
jgi:hypothetical protein